MLPVVVAVVVVAVVGLLADAGLLPAVEALEPLAVLVGLLLCAQEELVRARVNVTIVSILVFMI